MKVKAWTYQNDSRKGISFRCPGCGGAHSVITVGPSPWQYNGDPERPVLSPSVLVTHTNIDGKHVCHSFVGCNGAQPGQITFLSDSTHHLAGQTVDLPEWTPLSEGAI